MEKLIKVKGMNRRRRAEKIFYWMMLALPLLQFCIFYIGVNFNSILLSFQSIEMDTTGNGGYIYSWVGFENFAEVIRLCLNEYELVCSFGNSMMAYGIGLVFGTAPALLFSFYIYKKYPLGGFFKIVLFMPSLISAVAMVLIFKYFVENAYPAIMEALFNMQVEGLLANPDTTFATVIGYGVWLGFGGGILMYLGAMNSISESVVEAAHLDGITPMKEFFKITLPLIWPTLVTFLVSGIAGIFTNQLGLFTFFQDKANKSYYTYGYYMFLHTKAGMTEYPHVASMGLLMTLIVAPITLLARYLLEKFGPSVD